MGAKLPRIPPGSNRAWSVTLNELSDRRLAWQPDIYQRYSFLARLTDILSGEGSGALTLLDVGSGPIALTEAFVSPRFDIVRADVSQFDDPSIVLLHPGEPLPFEDAAFDVAVAIEVLEHVPPAQRPSLIRELQRVSRQATIVCCPIDTPEVVEAERQFSAYAQAVSGRDVDFLVEHRENGLPDAAEVVSWFSDPGSVLVADNAPLDEWLAFNVLDFIYACDLGDHEAKARFAAAVNTRAPLARAGAAHYRRFFCAFTSPAHAATAARVIDAARSPDPTEPQRLVRELVTGILGWRQELRERSTREVEATHRHIGELDAALLGFKEAVAEKDAHIGKLDGDARRASRGASAEKDAHIAELNQHLAEAMRSRAGVGRRASARRTHVCSSSMANADAAGLTALVERCEQTRSGKPEAHARLRRTRTADASALSAAHARLEESTRRATALERELQVILTSRSWRLTAPLRRFRRLSGAAPSSRFPSAPWRRMRRWVRERATRRRNYALAAESGLFDATCYRESLSRCGRHRREPARALSQVGRARRPRSASPVRLLVLPPVEPRRRRRRREPARALPHGRRVRRPRSASDFDSSFYLEGNPDVAAAGMNPLRTTSRAAGSKAGPRIQTSTERSTWRRTLTSQRPA